MIEQRVILDGSPMDYAHSWRVVSREPNGTVWLSGPGDQDNMAFARQNEVIPFEGRPQLKVVP